MKKIKFEVKSARKSEVKPDGTKERKVVAVIELTDYDNLAEMVSALGEQRVYELANAQSKTNEKNAARAAAVDEPSAAFLRNKALQSLITNPAKLAELQAATGTPGKVEEILAEEIARIKAEMGLPAAGAEEEDEAELAPSA